MRVAMLFFGWGCFVISHCGNCFVCYKVMVNCLACVISVLQLSTVPVADLRGGKGGANACNVFLRT